MLHEVFRYMCVWVKLLEEEFRSACLIRLTILCLPAAPSRMRAYTLSAVRRVLSSLRQMSAWNVNSSKCVELIGNMHRFQFFIFDLAVSSCEMTDHSPVMYVGLLQSGSPLKPRPLSHKSATPTCPPLWRSRACLRPYMELLEKLVCFDSQTVIYM